LPKRLRIQLTQPLSPDVYTVAQWKDGRLEQLELPPVGASVELAFTPGAISY
jgi:hypothetical protein